MINWGRLVFEQILNVLIVEGFKKLGFYQTWTMFWRAFLVTVLARFLVTVLARFLVIVLARFNTRLLWVHFIDDPTRGARKLTGENLKLVWAEFSTLS